MCGIRGCAVQAVRRCRWCNRPLCGECWDSCETPPLAGRTYEIPPRMKAIPARKRREGHDAV